MADDFKKDDVGIEIHSGKNRIVRRIFESLGYKVMKLDRVYFNTDIIFLEVIRIADGICMDFPIIQLNAGCKDVYKRQGQ